MGPMRRGSPARVLAAVAIVVLLVPGGMAWQSAATGSPLAPLAYVDPVLTEALAAADPSTPLQAVAVYPTRPGPVELAALDATGVTAVPFRSLDMVAVEGTASQLLAVAGLSGVASLWGNHPLDSVLSESRPLIQADAVHAELGVTGAGVTIAVLDSGIDGLHPDLDFGTKTIQNVKLLGHKSLSRDPLLTLENVENTDTTTGHGSHVASIAAGNGAASGGLYEGVAPGAALVGLGAADGVEMLTALAGYDWLLEYHDEYGIRVLNNSWADGTIAYDERDPLNVASFEAYEAGIAVVFAAGNDGQASGNVFNRYAWPWWVVSVAGADKLGQPATYSSLGDDVHHPTVTAPGSFIAAARASTGVVSGANSSPFDLTDPLQPRTIPVELTPWYRYGLGTSMSAPHVAGVAALMLEANSSLSPADVKRILADTAAAMPGCPPAACGSGLVNARAAVEAARQAAAHPPVAALSPDPAQGAAPLTVALDASASSDSDGAVVGWRWDLDGDGTFELDTASPVVEHVYAAGAWHPAVIAMDDDGLTSAPASAEVRASNPPVAVASAPSHGKSGAAITFDAAASSDPDGTIVAYRFVFGDGSEVVSTSPVVAHAYTVARPSRFAWAVVVTDDAGVSDAVGGTVKITP
jgi:serine protease AprX